MHHRAAFGENGFRLLMDRGAYFLNCAYDYANTSTAPGHATLLTGSYSNGHGILNNDWWDPVSKKMVAAVTDSAVTVVGVNGGGPSASPRNLLTSTLGDELKLATEGKSRVFTTAMKDRSAVFSAGFTAAVDAMAPTLLLAQAFGRLGNYFNQELFGLPTDLPWGLEIDRPNPAIPAGPSGRKSAARRAWPPLRWRTASACRWSRCRCRR